jgi:hypothetical protein
VKNKEDMRAAAEFVLKLGHEIARRIGISHGRVRYFDDERFLLSDEKGGFTISHGDGLSRRKLHAAPARLLQLRDGSFLVGIAIRVRRFEFTLVPSCIGLVLKLHRSTDGRFIAEASGRFSQGRLSDPQLYGRIFNWNEANIPEFVASFRDE